MLSSDPCTEITFSLFPHTDGDPKGLGAAIILISYDDKTLLPSLKEGSLTHYIAYRMLKIHMTVMWHEASPVGGYRLLNRKCTPLQATFI